MCIGAAVFSFSFLQFAHGMRHHVYRCGEKTKKQFSPHVEAQLPHEHVRHSSLRRSTSPFLHWRWQAGARRFGQHAGWQASFFRVHSSILLERKSEHVSAGGVVGRSPGDLIGDNPFRIKTSRETPSSDENVSPKSKAREPIPYDRLNRGTARPLKPPLLLRDSTLAPLGIPAPPSYLPLADVHPGGERSTADGAVLARARPTTAAPTTTRAAHLQRQLDAPPLYRKACVADHHRTRYSNTRKMPPFLKIAGTKIFDKSSTYIFQLRFRDSAGGAIPVTVLRIDRALQDVFHDQELLARVVRHVGGQLRFYRVRTNPSPNEQDEERTAFWAIRWNMIGTPRSTSNLRTDRRVKQGAAGWTPRSSDRRTDRRRGLKKAAVSCASSTKRLHPCV